MTRFVHPDCDQTGIASRDHLEGHVYYFVIFFYLRKLIGIMRFFVFMSCFFVLMKFSFDQIKLATNCLSHDMHHNHLAYVWPCLPLF